MLEFLNRKLQEFNQGDKDNDTEDIVIRRVRFRETRSQRIKKERIRERLWRILFDHTYSWEHEASCDELQVIVGKWKEAKRGRFY